MADNAQLELPTDTLTVLTKLKLWFGKAEKTPNIYGFHETLWSNDSKEDPLEQSEFRKGRALYDAIKQYFNHPSSQYNVACFLEK